MGACLHRRGTAFTLGTRAGVLTLFRPVYSNSSLIKPRSGCCGLRSVQWYTVVKISFFCDTIFCLTKLITYEPPQLSLKCRVLASFLTFLTGEFAKLKRGNVKRYAVALRV